MIEHEFGNHPQPAFMCLLEKGAKIIERPVAWVHREIIGDIVSVIAQGRRIKREQPNCGYAEIAEIAELPAQPTKVPDSVVVAIGERFDMELINNGILEPKRFVLVHSKEIDTESERDRQCESRAGDGRGSRVRCFRDGDASEIKQRATRATSALDEAAQKR
jgi:hypothetical protein